MHIFSGALAAIVALAILPASAADEAVDVKPTIAVVDQHMAVNFLSAMYYCENKHWPADVAAVRAFQVEKEVTLPVTADWTMIESSLTYAVSEASGEMTVHSEKELVPGAYAVTSTNQTPVCKGKNIEMRPHLNIGE